MLERLGLSPGGYLLAVGRLSPEKRLEDLIAAHHARMPQLPLVLAGDTNFTDEYISHLRRIAGPNVVFPGYVRGAALEELVSSALVYAICSSIEGVSLSLLEAMSLGCPIVASDIPGNREALGVPPAGLTFPAHDTEALGEALERLADDPALRARLGVAAATRAHAVFDWDAIAAATLRVYERALAGALSSRSEGREDVP